MHWTTYATFALGAVSVIASVVVGIVKVLRQIDAGQAEAREARALIRQELAALRDGQGQIVAEQHELRDELAVVRREVGEVRTDHARMDGRVLALERLHAGQRMGS